MELYEELKKIAEEFNDAGIDYALCGGIALAFHGFVRATDDIDFLIARKDLDRATALLHALGFNFPAGIIPFTAKSGRMNEVFRISKIADGEILTIDLLVAEADWQGLLAGRQQFPWDGTDLAVVSKPALITMKKLAGREQDMVDIKRLENEGKS